jgi:hypothetical protein
MNVRKKESLGIKELKAARETCSKLDPDIRNLKRELGLKQNLLEAASKRRIRVRKAVKTLFSCSQ